jgi:O-antigen/teichoic acid export membrane protein
MSGAQILRLLSMAVLLLGLNSINTSVLSGVGRPQDTAKAITIGAVCNIIANLFLIPRYGGVGSALSTLISSIVIFSMTSYFIRVRLPVRSPWVAWAKSLLAGIGFAIILLLSRLLNLNQFVKVGVAIAVGMIVYFGLLSLLRTVTRKELEYLRKRIMKT